MEDSFNPLNDSCILDLKDACEVKGCDPLLKKAMDEIKVLRHRLEIDRCYIYNGEEFIEEKVNDNSMIGSSDKIECLSSELNIIKRSFDIQGNRFKEFIRVNYGQGVLRRACRYVNKGIEGE